MSSEVITCNATQSLHSAYDLTLDDQSKERYKRKVDQYLEFDLYNKFIVYEDNISRWQLHV